MVKVVKKRRYSKQVTLLLVLVLVGISAGIYVWTTRPKPVKQSEPIAKSPTISKQLTVTQDKQLAAGGNNNQGNATQLKTPTPVTTSPSQWASSQSGVIVVQQPLAGATIKSGATLSGTAKTDSIQFRLIDDTTGVISQGPIDVKNGKFSVSINFSPQAKTGRLDVFTISDVGGESDEVQIKVNF